jgi:hypothetical protein
MVGGRVRHARFPLRRVDNGATTGDAGVAQIAGRVLQS